MKKALILIPIIALLTACGTTDPYGKRAEQERARQEKYVTRTIDQAPDWMVKLPTSSSAIYSSGTSSSGDFSMAVHKAKADAYAKICMSAGGTASQRTKIYKADSATTSSELSEMVIRTQCKEIDITGVETADKKIISEGNRYRAYVLIVLPTGDANVLKRANEQQKLNEEAARRAPEAFKELDEPVQSLNQSGRPVSVVRPDGSTSTLNLMPVENAEYKARREEALKKPGAVVGQVSVAN
ncbi:hypothetical protein UFOVP181_208 [uncultured Caudovirales phage]|uniref:LPP20 lipoprotein n=1 Tax=uncultured Caudovirales phage TaxID=2100421 RepID=A0A6J5L0U5_9CAUD|nr:hypothetical protein UFOVP57_431 [uncultured Caudovirales phage]CAB5208838.1 hypothetical protein UFOVP181_208 [uncultured Caudovirales phage]